MPVNTIAMPCSSAAAMTEAGLSASNSEAFRLIKQGCVWIDGEKVTDRRMMLPAGFEGVMKVGKRRIARLEVVDAVEGKE